MFSLERFHVLDLSRIVPGPFATHVLADLGMDVIRVDEVGSRMADTFMPANLHAEKQALYVATNSMGRNKRSLSLNFRDRDPQKKAAALEVLYKLAKWADVVIEGYRPGAAKYMGFDYETIRKHNPGVVYCSMSGYGQTGPLSGWGATGAQFDSLAGTVDVDENGPVPHPFAYGDFASSLYAATCIVSALFERESSGEGAYLDVSCTAAALSFNVHSTTVAARGEGRKHEGWGPRGINFVECRDGKWLSAAMRSPDSWQAFCKLINKPEWAKQSRAPESGPLVDEVRAIFRTRDRTEWLKLLGTGEMIIAPVYDASETLEEAQFLETGMVLEVNHPIAGKAKQLGFPVQISGKTVTLRTFAVKSGENTRDVLAEAGFAATDVERLLKDGTVQSA